MQESFEGEGLARPQRGEFLCPVCRRLANALLPVAPCEPPILTLPEGADGGGGSSEEEQGDVREPPDTAGWAAAALAAPPPEAAVAPSVPLRRQIESFLTLAACTQLRLPQMSIDEHDWRALRMPAAMLAHNARLADALARLPPVRRPLGTRTPGRMNRRRPSRPVLRFLSARCSVAGLGRGGRARAAQRGSCAARAVDDRARRAAHRIGDAVRTPRAHRSRRAACHRRRRPRRPCPRPRRRLRALDAPR